MKKLGIAALTAGCLMTIVSGAAKIMQVKLMSSIGGQDGPTAVFVAGKAGGHRKFSLAFSQGLLNGNIQIIGIVAGLLIAAAGIVIIIKQNSLPQKKGRDR